MVRSDRRKEMASPNENSETNWQVLLNMAATSAFDGTMSNESYTFNRPEAGLAVTVGRTAFA